MADPATGGRRVPRLDPEQGTSWTLGGLTDGVIFYWAVQAVDPALAGGPFSAEGSFIAGAGPTPGAIATPSPSSTPLPTQTPGGPTATPTPCTGTFSDVPFDSPFYVNIRCLTCRGIIGGYSDVGHCPGGAPCFQPGANVTRGQMSKFIAGAAGYTDVIPPDRQTFTDVPSGSTFWLFVERAYAHGVIGGYTDSAHCPGGVPCFQVGPP